MNNEMTINKNADLEKNDVIKSRITEARATLKATLAKYAELAKELRLLRSRELPQARSSIRRAITRTSMHTVRQRTFITRRTALLPQLSL